MEMSRGEKRRFDASINERLEMFQQNLPHENDLEKLLHNSERIAVKMCEIRGIKDEDYERIANIWRFCDFVYLDNVKSVAEYRGAPINYLEVREITEKEAIESAKLYSRFLEFLKKEAYSKKPAYN